MPTRLYFPPLYGDFLILAGYLQSAERFDVYYLSTHEYELSNHLSTTYTSFALVRVLRTGAFCRFGRKFFKKFSACLAFPSRNFLRGCERMLINVSCLHFGQKRGKFLSSVSSRIFHGFCCHKLDTESTQ